MTGCKRSLLAILLGLALAVLLLEAILRLLQMPGDAMHALAGLAAGPAEPVSLMILVGAVGLLAAVAGGALTGAFSGRPLLALPVALAFGLPLSFTALVGLQPVAWVLALLLLTGLGGLLAARLVQHLQQLDASQVDASVGAPPDPAAFRSRRQAED